MSTPLLVRIAGQGAIAEATRDIVSSHGCVITDAPSCDIFLLANETRLIRAPELALCRLGALCFHPSLLPRHRGRDSVYWTIKMGDRISGISWFWLDTGIDTGPIAISSEVNVPPDCSPRRLYDDWLVPLGIQALQELLPRLIAGERPSTTQDESLATYERPRQRHGVSTAALR